MTEHEPQSSQQFEHFQDHYARDIADVVSAVHDAATGASQARVAAMFDDFFGPEAAQFIAPSDSKPDPEAILKKAMSKLSDAHRIELVVGNLLEGVKRGQKLEDLVESFSALGLMQRPATGGAPQPPPPPAVEEPDGAFLQKTVGWPRKIGLTLWRIGVNAIRTIPRFAKLKPKARFGFVGPLPSFHLEFEIEPDGLTIHELGELLFRGVGATHR